MNKRDFLKVSLASVVAADAQTPRKNWAGNHTYRAKNLLTPKTLDEARRMVKSAGTLKALGTAHAFNGIADNDTNQISLRELRGMQVSADKRTVTVGAGVKYGELAPYLHAQGLAVHNLASLPHISVAGGCATATHGSGTGNLSSAVVGMQMITADGEVVTLSQKDADFAGCVVHLGGLGVVTALTLQVVPTFEVSQVVYEGLSFRQLEKSLEEIFAAGYSVSLFTDWQKETASEVWVKSKGAVQASKDFFGARPLARNVHPIIALDAVNCTEQRGVAGPWYDRLPHFRMNFTPSSGDELQTEFFVPRAQAYGAIRAVETLRDQITPHLLITELRSINKDDLWMSTAYGRDSMAIHFTWKPHGKEVAALIPQVEAKLAPFGARPHWAKLFTPSPARMKGVYPKLPEFVKLMKKYDPAGKFRSGFLTAVLG
ncbi:xylitol oxidase [Bryobacterales bacterium F-183]|nr:xylitol oxidase [Bryobacterales bacterium F-183]